LPKTRFRIPIIIQAEGLFFQHTLPQLFYTRRDFKRWEFSYTETTLKIGNLTRKLFRIFARRERALPKGKARVKTKIQRKSRRRQKPIFKVVSV